MLNRSVRRNGRINLGRPTLVENIAWTTLFKWCLILLLAITSPVVLAQNVYPSKTVKIVVPFPPGGIVDFLGRLFARHLSDALGQTFIVENRTGAGTNIGAEFVAKSQADGYTLFFGSSANTVNMTLYKQPGYDIVKDFSPVALVVFAPNILLANPQLPVNSLSDLMKLGKSHLLTYASAGYGSPSHIAAEKFIRAARIELRHVPYKGAPPAALDVMAGRVDLLFSNIPATIVHIKSGKLKAIAVASAARSSSLPDVPTFAEAGLKDYSWMPWYGLLAPAGTPPTVVERLNEEVNRLLGMGEVIQRLVENGTIPAPRLSSAEFATQIVADVASNRELIQATGITIQ